MRWFIFFLFLLPAPAIAAEPQATSVSCGNTVGEALKEARAAVVDNNPARDRKALLCVIEAVEKLNKAFPTRSDDNPVIHVPSTPGTWQHR